MLHDICQPLALCLGSHPFVTHRRAPLQSESFHVTYVHLPFPNQLTFPSAEEQRLAALIVVVVVGGQGGDVFGAKASEILVSVRGKDFRSLAANPCATPRCTAREGCLLEHTAFTVVVQLRSRVVRVVRIIRVAVRVGRTRFLLESDRSGTSRDRPVRSLENHMWASC